MGCKQLRTIHLPHEISISDGAFMDFSELQTINIPFGTTKIPQNTFRNCTKLKYLTLPDTIQELGECAFYDCSSLEEITLPPIGKIPDWCFRGCEKLKHLYIPSSVKEIGTKAIILCHSLLSIQIPEGVINMGDYAIWNCTKISSITLPNSLQELGEHAIYNCPSLKEICVPKGQRTRFIAMGLEKYADIIVERDNEELTILTNLAKAYELGIGVQKNIAQAILTYTQAAEKGGAEAAYRLAEWYAEGETLPKDLNKALAFYQQAAKSAYYDVSTKAEALQKQIEDEQKQQEEQMTLFLNEENEYRSTMLRQQNTQNKTYMSTAKLIFFDTETTGIPRLYNAPITDSSNWPRLVQLAWLTADANGNILKRKSVIIRPEGFTISYDAASVHGITTERALRAGKTLKEVLQEFTADMEYAERIIGHNIDFDIHIVGAELYRMGMPYNHLLSIPTTCTMKSSTDFCAIPSNSRCSRYKWPKLQELYYKLFGTNFSDAHDALADITATKDCYFELINRCIIRQ